MITTLAICDSDIEYSTRLMNYLKRNQSMNLDISIFTKTNSLEEFLHIRQDEHCVILINENMMSENGILEMYKNTLILTEVQDKVNHGDEYLFKYQNVSNILNSILSLHMNGASKYQKKFSGDKKRILTIFDMNNDLIKLKLSWLISRNLSQYKKTLFIILDIFNTSINNNDISNFNLSELIYYSKDTSNLEGKLLNLLEVENHLEYISGITHPFDILSLEKENIMAIINEIKTRTDFEYIVFYSNVFTSAINDIMNISEDICIPIIESNYENAILMEWDRQYNLCNPSKDYSTIHIDYNDASANDVLNLDNPKTNDLMKYARKYCERFINE
ncbi:MAG TPA: hypothetical protein GXZ90_07760 [Clostridiales bacterium]|nr:hypothetical protein [Clostridiales bacterium]